MSALLMILGVVLIGAAVVCNIIVIIDAFRNEIWKGVLYLVCGLYGLYYVFAEFEHEKKVLIIVVMFLGSILGYGLMFGAGMMGGSGTTVTP